MRMTMPNPGGRSYRLTQGRGGEIIRREYQLNEWAYYGKAVNLLGQYEDLGTIEELRALKEKAGRRP